MKYSSRIRQLIKDREGVALIEFAIAAPVLFLILFAAIELANFVYIDQKLKNANYNVLNLINNQLNLNETQIEDIASIVPQVVRPYFLNSAQYKVVVTAIRRDLIGDPTPYVEWQWPRGFNEASRFAWKEGRPNSENTVTPEQVNYYSFAAGDQVITVELQMQYRPLFNASATRRILGLIGSNLYFYSSGRPRPGVYDLSPYRL